MVIRLQDYFRAARVILGCFFLVNFWLFGAANRRRYVVIAKGYLVGCHPISSFKYAKANPCKGSAARALIPIFLPYAVIREWWKCVSALDVHDHFSNNAVIRDNGHVNVA